MPRNGNPWGPEASPYEAIGGEAAVRTLVEAFYDRVDAESPVLRAMLPRERLGISPEAIRIPERMAGRSQPLH